MEPYDTTERMSLANKVKESAPKVLLTLKTTCNEVPHYEQDVAGFWRET